MREELNKNFKEALKFLEEHPFKGELILTSKSIQEELKLALKSFGIETEVDTAGAIYEFDGVDGSQFEFFYYCNLSDEELKSLLEGTFTYHRLQFVNKAGYTTDKYLEVTEARDRDNRVLLHVKSPIVDFTDKQEFIETTQKAIKDSAAENECYINEEFTNKLTFTVNRNRLIEVIATIVSDDRLYPESFTTKDTRVLVTDINEDTSKVIITLTENQHAQW